MSLSSAWSSILPVIPSSASSSVIPIPHLKLGQILYPCVKSFWFWWNCLSITITFICHYSSVIRPSSFICLLEKNPLSVQHFSALNTTCLPITFTPSVISLFPSVPYLHLITRQISVLQFKGINTPKLSSLPPVLKRHLAFCPFYTFTCCTL